MNREFLEFYDREIKLLRSQAAEFALEYPGIADRLGGLVGDRQDPMIVGLLEGAAFLAARVQLKLKHEFSEFTTNLIDQLAPQYLAPAPSYVLIEALADVRRRGLARGAHHRPRRLSRRDLSRGGAQRGVPVSSGGADHDVAL